MGMTQRTHGQQIHRHNTQGWKGGDAPMGQPGHADHQNHDPQQQHKNPSEMTAKLSAIDTTGSRSGPRIDSDPVLSREFEGWPMRVKLWLEYPLCHPLGVDWRPTGICH